MLSDDYETEQAELKEKIELLNKEIQEFQEKTDNIESLSAQQRNMSALKN